MNAITTAVLLAALGLCTAARADTPPPAAPGWTWGAVTPAEGGTLEETHAYGVVASAPAGLAPGRYRLTITARFDTPQASKLVVTQPAGTHDYAGEVRSLTGYPADASDQWKTLRYDFDVEAGVKEPVRLSYADYVHLGNDHPGAPKPGRLQVQAATLKVEKLPLAVGVSYARPVKIRCQPGEAGVIEASLTNGTGQARTVQIRPALLDENDTALPGPAKTVAMPALSTVAVRLPFTAPQAQGGYEAQAQIVDAGRVVDAKGDVFADADNPFSFAIRGSWGVTWTLDPPVHSLDAARTEQAEHWDKYITDNTGSIRWMRSTYVTYFEYMAWAHEDATILTEPGDDPYLGGQASEITSRKLIRLTNGMLKAQGIAPVAYVNAEPFGWSGFEVFRQNPEWFRYYTLGGPPSAGFNTEELEKYNAGTNPAGGDYPFIEPTYDAVSQATGLRYVDFHVKQLEDSAKQYGWEAYRYDAGPLPVKYYPMVKARLAKLSPPVFVGGNQSIVDLGPVQTPAWNVYCRGGSLMMDEAIDAAFDDPNSPNRQWSAWRDYLRTGAELTRRNGGYYQFIVQQGNWLATTLGYAVGGHPYSYGTLQNPYGESERFMLRYGYLFWDLKSQLLPIPQVKQSLSVTSARPLWWDASVNERILDPKRRQVIVPLINTPTGTTVNDVVIPSQASGVRVTFTPRPGEAVQAFLYAPEPTPHRRALPMTRLPGGQVSVAVPPFWAWTNVVFDCRKGAK